MFVISDDVAGAGFVSNTVFCSMGINFSTVLGLSFDDSPVMLFCMLSCSG